MESNNGPVDFDRTWSVIQLLHNNHEERAEGRLGDWMSCVELLPCDVLAIAEEMLNEERFITICSGTVHGEKFMGEVIDFIQQIAARASLERVKLGLNDGYHFINTDLGSETTLAFPIDRAPYRNLKHFKQLPISAVTEKQVREFINAIYSKYHRAIIEPGEPVGAISGESFGEPATQMTLKTFHFAGVASMDITQGVPRIKEIINATTSISTPIISVELLNNQDEISARVCKGRLESTFLGEVAEYIKEVFTPEMCFLDIKLDMEAIQKLYIPVRVRTDIHRRSTRSQSASPSFRASSS